MSAPLQAPFPWFGGKSGVAHELWARFGRADNYVVPFAGSLADVWEGAAQGALPRTVTLNDLDGHLINFWRAVSADPDTVAHWLNWPVSEIDLFARHVWLVRQRDTLAQRLMADPDYYDSKAAGWWCWGACAWIGTGWCSGEGPWWVDEQGAIVNIRESRGNAGRGVNRQLPHLGDAGRGAVEILGEHLREYMRRLRDVLRTCRITCGDWSRVVTPAVTFRHGITAILLDPPYGEGAQQYATGGNSDASIAQAVWEWALANGDNPELRIAVCAYDDGRKVPEGWSAHRWKAKGGYGVQGDGDARQNSSREIVYFSPHCVNETPMDALLRMAQEAA